MKEELNTVDKKNFSDFFANEEEPPQWMAKLLLASTVSASLSAQSVIDPTESSPVLAA
jgi:hypothetical protein